MSNEPCNKNIAHREDPPVVHPGMDFQTEMRVKMDYTVKELNRQGKILGNGDRDGIIARMNRAEAWIHPRQKIEWIVLGASVLAVLAWSAKAFIYLIGKV